MSTLFSLRRADTLLPLVFLCALACNSDEPTTKTRSPSNDDDGRDDADGDGETSQDDVTSDDARASPRRPDAGTPKLDAAVEPVDGGKPLDAGTKPSQVDAQPPSTTVDSGAGTKGDTDSAVPTTPSSSFANSTLIPHASWTCGMPEGIPSPVGAPVVFTASLDIANIREVGDTRFGKRQLIEVNTGTFKGPKLDATVMAGGLDQPLLLSNGAVELEQILTLKTKDGKYIYLRVCGTAPHADEPMRVVMDFEAPNGSSVAFLNTTKLVGTRELDAAGKKLTLTVSDVSQVAPSASSVKVDNPAGVVDQTWDCKVDKGTAGTQIYKEVVNIGGSLSVGASKRGNRNIIPITGGTTTGRIKGSVLPGGGDFQILDGGFLLDARYTVKSDEGELILVRNCGPAAALVPVFEARAAGCYAFLNANDWLSSSPSVGLGTVTLTTTEKR
ncbi:MAG: hypothetical protein RLZZ450_4425 [Pseudomonadota bacterium]|jgi:hypothetical protein